MATKRARGRRRTAISITLARAARLFRLVQLLADATRTRDEVRETLGIGLRTFYRELELLKRLGVRVRFRDRSYALLGTMTEAEARLPFPDPHLTFAELRDLIGCPGTASRRLAEMFADLLALADPQPTPRRPRGRKPSPQG